MWDLLREQLKQMGIEKLVHDEFRSGIALKERLAFARQARLARHARNNPRRGVDGLGQTQLIMDPFFRALADVRFGRGWTKDKAVIRELKRENPEFKVPYQKRPQAAGFRLEDRDASASSLQPPA